MDHYGILSIVPPILAIVLALKTKNIIVSLFFGLYFGAIVLAGWNPVAAFANLIPDFIYAQVATDSNMQSITNLCIIGGFVALISASGGAAAFAKTAEKWVKKKRTAETAMWLGGLFVWFTDSGNSLLVGPIFQPIAERFRVSREKFAYILDATSSPICALVPVISWGVDIMGLIDAELEKIPNLADSSWNLFLEAIPYQFYNILTLVMVGYICLTQFDFGPMLKAQKRAEQTGKTIRDGGVPMRSTVEVKLPEGVEPKAISVVVPLAIMLITMFTIFFLNGFPQKSIDGIVIRQGIALGFILGGIAAGFINCKLRIFTPKQVENKVFDGMKDMMFLIVMMILSWSLGSVCSQMGTAYYILEVTQDFLNPAVLPAILFLIGCCMSLATGSSWGTFAILIPIGFPIAAIMGTPLAVTVAAVISGGVFGDQCSPISDTTMLASMGSACDHIDHFRTQFPYACTVAAVSVVLYLIAGYTEHAWIVIAGAAILFAVVAVLHKISVRLLKNTKSEYPLS